MTAKRVMGAVLAAWALRAGALAEAPPPEGVPPPLALEQAVAEALRANPGLRGRRAEAGAQDERPAQARALPDPMLSLGGMSPLSGGRWPDTEEKRYMLEQVFPAPGKRGLRGEMAEREAEAMRLDAEALARELVMEVKAAYFDLRAVQRQSDILVGEEQVLRGMAAVAETLYAAGTRSRQDLLKAQTEITLLKRTRLDLEAREAAVKARLNNLLNREADAPIGRAVTEPSAIPAAGSGEGAGRGWQDRPEIRGAEAIRKGREAELRLMKRENWPDFRAGVEYRDLAGEDMAMITVGVDLPIWRGRIRSGVREAEKRLEAAQAAREAALRQADREVREARVNLLKAERTRALYREELLPQAQARFEASESDYRAGRADFMDFLESQRFLLEARTMEAMAEGEVGMQAARLERALGVAPPRNGE